MSKINRELDNYFAIVHDLATGAEEWTSRPAWLEFAPNNVCNLRCPMCTQSEGLPLEVMPTEDTIRVLDQVLPHASLMTPTALSEPMLANIKLIVQKCREHEVFLNFNSNCTVLDGKRFAEIADRMHKLWISYDSPDKATFERVRAPASFEQVRKNVREILPIAAERNIPVGFVAVLLHDNLHQLPDLVDDLADLGAVEAQADLRVQQMVENSAAARAMDVFAHHSHEEIREWIERACVRAEERGLIFHADLDGDLRRAVSPQAPRVRGIVPDILTKLTDTVKEKYSHFCYMASYYMKIDPLGRVYPCCVAPHELEMGNVNDASVEEIWNGERYREFRRKMNDGDYPQACRGCEHLVFNPRFDKARLAQEGVEASGG